MKKHIDKLLTIEETARILRVSTRTIARYIESGRLKASKLGTWRIKETDILKMLEETSNVNVNNKK
ncbi:MAG: helix-turn-helix domain-containing protein [Candidatus Pacebacteria bacterium]|nr:helix-turn-helix domain-containing protein [Candidatus Paceibacterota bacterium]